ELKEQVGDLPVVFINSYRDASVYAFYSGSDVYSANDAYRRKSQFDLDSSEWKVQHKKVALLSGKKEDPVTSEIHIQKRWRSNQLNGHFVEDFTTHHKMKL